MSDLLPPPATLVDARGAPHEGAYLGTIPQATLDRAQLPGLGPLRAVPAVRALRRKAWRFVGVFRDDLVLAAAVADVGYLGLAWTYVAEGSRIVERGWKAPGALGMKVGGAAGTTVALAPGRLVTLASKHGGGLTVAIDLPGIVANLDLAADSTPLTVVSDVARGAGLHGITVKSAGVLAQGVVEVEGRGYTLDDARACVDWTEAYFPRKTAWLWATASGIALDGRPFGFNLARGVHDDARGRFNENALWLDGTPSALPPVHFTPGKGSTPWSIHSSDGAVDLVFESRGERAENVNYYLVRSRYRQPFGTFTGRLRDARGREVRFEGVPGVTEDHECVW
jgi:hypothetical protein